MKADATAILRAPALTQASPGIGFAGSERCASLENGPGAPLAPILRGLLMRCRLC